MRCLESPVQGACREEDREFFVRVWARDEQHACNSARAAMPWRNDTYEGRWAARVTYEGFAVLPRAPGEPLWVKPFLVRPYS